MNESIIGWMDKCKFIIKMISISLAYYQLYRFIFSSLFLRGCWGSLSLIIVLFDPLFVA